jgi:hypothetical protein
LIGTTIATASAARLFTSCFFEDVSEENTRKVGILFEKPYHCAVLDVAKLSAGSIAFGFNSYRGDVFQDTLRAALRFPMRKETGP